MRLLLLGLMLSVLPFLPAFAQDTNVIAVFGDSLAAGYGVAPQDSFPSQLEARLNADGYHAKVLNDGVSGDTTAGGVSRIDYVLAQKPDAVIIILGGNDLLRAIPPAEILKNLTIITLRLNAAGIKLLVAGQKAPVTLGMAYANAYNDIFCTVAKKVDGQCYPFFLKTAYGHAELMQDDGIHTNKQGVAVVLNDMYPQILTLIKK